MQRESILQGDTGGTKLANEKNMHASRVMPKQMHRSQGQMEQSNQLIYCSFSIYVTYDM